MAATTSAAALQGLPDPSRIARSRAQATRVAFRRSRKHRIRARLPNALDVELLPEARERAQARGASHAAESCPLPILACKRQRRGARFAVGERAADMLPGVARTR